MPRGEAALWVDQWVGASKALNHWEALGEYARATEQTELAVEAAWRMYDWGWLKVRRRFLLGLWHAQCGALTWLGVAGRAARGGYRSNGVQRQCSVLAHTALFPT